MDQNAQALAHGYSGTPVGDLFRFGGNHVAGDGSCGSNSCGVTPESFRSFEPNVYVPQRAREQGKRPVLGIDVLGQSIRVVDQLLHVRQGDQDASVEGHV